MPAPIRIANFRGERPGIGARLLPDGYAQSARNCRLIDGQIVPMRDVTDVETITEVLDHRAKTSDGYESTWQYVQNRGFARDKLFWTEGAGWLISGSRATHSPGAAGSLDQSMDRLDAMPRIKPGLSYTIEFTVSNYVAGTVTPIVGGNTGSAENSDGDKSQNIIAGSVDTLLRFDASNDAQLKIDSVSATLNMGSFAAAAGGSYAWIRLAWHAEDNPGVYDGWTVRIVAGTGKGQQTTIVKYYGSESGKFHVADVQDDWVTVPDETSVYELYQPVATTEVKSLYKFFQGNRNILFTADDSTDYITTENAHELQNGDPITLSTTGTLPGGLSLGVTYFVTNRTFNTMQLLDSLGGSLVDITSPGTGTHYLSKGLWFRWGVDVDVAKTPLSADENDITIFTGQGIPKLTYKGLADDKPLDEISQPINTTGYPKQWYTLGVPEPRIDEDDDVEAGGGAGDDFYLTYTSDQDDTDLYSDLQAVGWDGVTWKNFKVFVGQVGNPVSLGATASGTGMFIQATWPVNTTITITILSGSSVHGGGGAAGSANGGNGGNGGKGIYVEAAFSVTLTINNQGFVAGGGGGGGGGGLAKGSVPTLEKDSNCDGCACCTAAGGAGGRGQGNQTKTNGSGGGSCGGGNCNTAICTPTFKTGGTGGNGGDWAANATASTNGSGCAGGCTGCTNGGTSGTGGPAIDGISKMTYNDTGTTTGAQIN